LPFGLKTSDFTVFDLADLTPPDPPRRYRLLGGLLFGLVSGLVLALPTRWTFRRSALSSRLTLVWPSTRHQLLDFLRRASRGLMFGLVFGLVWVLVMLGLGFSLSPGLTVWSFGLFLTLVAGLILALRNGGWFALLQKVAHRRLARAGNLPLRPYDFLEWGIDRQIFRRVGGGVRFRHNLIQQHLASTSAEAVE
jgi:hypothetical protein